MSSDLNHLPPEIQKHRILNTAEAAAFCNLSLPHFRTLYRTGQVPAPIKLSARKLGWKAGTLIEWLDARAHRAA